jgi:acetyl-CoA carboxylase biotin carboxylase subunit
MRRVDDRAGIAAAFQQASSEAQSAFGDGSLYLETFLERPRHVEIQVMADRFGHTLHLGERECSVQRRHQKLIEESPSPALDLQLRLRMGEAAVQAARSVGYLGAGTVEFLLESGGRFFFLEMNTRIQVEHPVTEAVYGVDLVREQLRIAGGEPTSLPGRPLTPRGHAIECRITSEDPANDFLPATGRIEYLRVPSGPGVRWDGGIEVGTEVGLFYDPLLGKLITWGETRDRALRRMRRALEELVIVGVPTSQPFHRAVLEEPEFLSGSYDIGYFDRQATALLSGQAGGDVGLAEIAVAAALAEEARRGGAVAPSKAPDRSGEDSPWLRAARLRGLR